MVGDLWHDGVKLDNTFATPVGPRSFVALMTLVLLWAINDTNFFGKSIYIFSISSSQTRRNHKHC